MSSELQTVTKGNRPGPGLRRDVPIAVLEYWTFREEIYLLCNGLLFKSQHIITIENGNHCKKPCYSSRNCGMFAKR